MTLQFICAEIEGLRLQIRRQQKGFDASTFRH